MEREEWESAGACAQCGASVARDSERGFEFGVGNLLCWGCAIERGGQYDAELERWSVSPNVAGLPDEAYGSAPHEVRRTRD